MAEVGRCWPLCRKIRCGQLVKHPWQLKSQLHLLTLKRIVTPAGGSRSSARVGVSSGVSSFWDSLHLAALPCRLLDR
jgi:hypothetical protein